MKRIAKMHLAVVMAFLMLMTSVIGAVAYAAESNVLTVAYYATMSQAFADINAGKWGANSLVQGEGAPVRTSFADGGYVIDLQQDYDEPATVTINTSYPTQINFNRYVLRSSNTGLDIISGSVTITAENEGGIIARGTTRARAAQLRAGTLTVNGGRYEAYSSAGQACCFLAAGELTIKQARMHAEDLLENGKARCVEVKNTAVLDLEQSILYAGVQNGVAIAVYAVAGSRSTMRNCVVDAYSNYVRNSSASSESVSIGVANYGELDMTGCSVFGTHSGVQSLGKLSIIGGSFSGYGHGGLYIANNSNVAYISRATFSAVMMPAGYTAANTFNDAGMYIGEGNNIRVYMDHCWVDSGKYPIVLRSSSGETNNALYISNTILGCSKNLRIDENSNHHVYVGVGNQCNLPATDATETNEDYGTIISENIG